MRPHALLRCAAVLLLVTAPLALLLVRVPGRVEVPLLPLDEPGDPLPVLLDVRQVTPTLKEAAGVLFFPDPALLLQHDAIELVTATYGAPVDLVLADAAVEGTNCTFVADPKRGLPNNARLVLVRSTSCAFLQGAPTKRVILRVAYEGPRGIALWTRVPKDVRLRAVPRLAYPPVLHAGTEGMLEGALVRYGGPSLRRSQLLAFMWRGEISTAWLWTLLGLGAALFAGGATRPAPHGVAATFLVAIGLGILYVVLVPPLQAPDEPTHLMTFARVTNQEPLTSDTGHWARQLHFERIRFHPEERFRAADMANPLMVNWSLVSVQDANRSAATSRMWSALAWLLPEMRAAPWLMTLRLVGALVLAGALAALAVAARPSAAGGSGNPAVALLLVPTLPFFGMHVSNHALLASAYVLIAGAAALGVWRPDRPLPAGLLLGAGQALAVAGGRIGLAVLPFTLAIAAGWIGLNVGSRARFLHGLATGLALLLIAAGPGYLARLAEPFWRRPVVTAVGAAIALVLAAVVLRALTRTSWWTSAGIARAALAAAAVPPLLLVLSLLVNLPRIEAASTTSLGGYVIRAVAAVATFPRLRGADTLSSDTFWGGFGWLDAYPPVALMTGLVILTAVSVSARLAQMRSDPDHRQWGWLLILAAGFFPTVALLAAGSYLFAPELHGRYLLGAFLPALAVLWTPWADDRRGPWLIAAIATIHGCCLATLLIRYF